MRRNLRNMDPYQESENLLRLVDKLIMAIYPDGKQFSAFKKLLFAIQHNERKSGNISKSGRRSGFDENFLTSSAIKLKTVLQNETKNKITLLRFISTYLPVLSYPDDIKKALNNQEINLAEARSLSRINSLNLGSRFQSKPSQIRGELLSSHLKKQDTQAELERRVNVKLNLTPKAEAKNVTNNIILLEDRNDEFLELTEFDTEHLLWEEIKGLVYLVREIDLKRFSKENIEEILTDLDDLKFKINKYGKEQKLPRIINIAK